MDRKYCFKETVLKALKVLCRMALKEGRPCRSLSCDILFLFSNSFKSWGLSAVRLTDHNLDHTMLLRCLEEWHFCWLLEGSAIIL
jgi:hypothetical protein